MSSGEINAGAARQELYWRTLSAPGFEHCSVERNAEGVVADGLFLRKHDGKPLRVHYRIEFDANWRARRVHAVRCDEPARSVSLLSDGAGHWTDENKHPLLELDGCLDVDLMGTPLTNTPAIQRLHLAEGQQARIPVAYIRIPDLVVSRKDQSYTRLDRPGEHYRYESDGFRAVLSLDDAGFVANYEGQWQRADVAPAATTLTDVLPSAGPSPELGKAAAMYDWLIGRWELGVRDYEEGKMMRQMKGEVVFGWVLEGRAVQDVWIMPPRGERAPQESKQAGNRYGTTLRVYDPALDAWRVTWINPVTGRHDELIGRKVGADIVQEGRTDGGELQRWSFRDITPTSFHWTGESSADGGKTWQMGAEFFGRRIDPAP